MSLEAMQRVWHCSKSKGTARVVMLAIADCADENGVAWPSIGFLCRRAGGVDRRGMIRHLQALVAAGEITAIGEGCRGVIKYRIALAGPAATSGEKTTSGTRATSGEKTTSGTRATSGENATTSSGENTTGTGGENATQTQMETKSNPKRAKAATTQRVGLNDLEAYVQTGAFRDWKQLSAPSVDPMPVIERMRDYCASRGKHYHDYAAALRNWMRTEQQRFEAHAEQLDLGAPRGTAQFHAQNFAARFGGADNRRAGE
jgi:hypothetical protein